jgi:eukaryotic-like serine/threonine-protein kinase
VNELDLFTEALSRTDPAERAAFLDQACAGNPELRRRLEELLAGHARGGSPLDRPPVPAGEVGATVDLPTAITTGEHRPDGATQAFSQPDPDATTAPESASPAPHAAGVPTGEGVGTVIASRYTLVEVIGEGGMGSVYLASQTDPVKRQVALKLIKTGMDSRGVLARFDAERQALALMDHPNIARIYDGGLTPAGQPFFVMELVKGVPLTEYCDQKRLTVKARLELFVAVCQAVQHAHQKGIIHRDLKPGNVLVTEVDGRPTPKVIDFGVAKATEVKLTDMSFADVGAIVGTPAYMSPEQADPSSMDIDTRTDVYALGVILYELLTGAPPIDARQFQRGAILEMLRMVREVDPPRPSTRLSTAEALPNIAANRSIEPAQLRRAMRGDLDWIVMKALEKDRARRFDTANGFAADVLRHLANEPVLAAPPSRAYRMRKFVRKNRGAVIAASLVLLALLGGIAGTTWGLFREAQRVEERDHQLGIGNFLLAAAAYDNRDVVGAADRLDKVPPGQRGWEWRYLKRQTRGGLFTLYGHTNWVESVGFSPDGTRIVTGSGDETAKVWDSRTGTPLLELKGHTSRVESVGFSPDGTRIVTGSGDNTAKVWDARTGTPLLELKGASGPVRFSLDGTRIVTGSGDNTAKVWDARTGTPLLVLQGHTNSVNSASFSPDGTRIVTGSWDQTAKVWDARTGSPILELKGHTDQVRSVSFSPDGTRVVTGSQDSTAKVWDARTGTPLLELTGASGPVSFSPDGTRIVTGGEDNTAKVWDARNGNPLLELKGHTNAVTSVSYSRDGTRIVTGSWDETAKVWDARTGTPLLDLKGHTNSVTSVSFSRDGTRIVTGSHDKTAKVWDARTGNPLLELKGHTSEVMSVNFSPDGTRIVTGSGDPSAKVWDARTGTPLLELKRHTDVVTSVGFSPNGTRIVTGCRDRTAKVWDTRTGTPLLVLQGHTNAVESVSFSPDGTRIVTGSHDKTAKVWDARTGNPLLDLKGHTSEVVSVSFSPDGTRIVTGSLDEAAKVWDARTGTPMLDLKGHTNAVTSVSFSRDGTRIVTGSLDETAKVWDARNGTPLLELKGHTSGVWSVSFSPDGTRIVTVSGEDTAKVTGSGDGTAKVWDARTGNPLLDLKVQTSWAMSVSFSPDGTRIVIRDADETTKVWDARNGQELKGEPTPQNIRPGEISPDGKFFAHLIGDHVEVIPKTIDAEEREYRLIHTRPNERRYAEEYAAARQAKDDFAARFFLDLLLSLPGQRTIDRFRERNTLAANPLVIARTGFHHPELAKTPYDRRAVTLRAVSGDRLAQRLTAQQLLRDGKPGQAIPLLLLCQASRRSASPPVEELLLAQAYLDLKQPDRAKSFTKTATEWLDRPRDPNDGMGDSFQPGEDPRRNPFDWESWHECDVFRAEVERRLAGKP